MRIPVRDENLPPGMTGAWHVDAHEATLPALPSAAQLVSAVFGLKLATLKSGDALKTFVGRFDVECVEEHPELSQVVLVTGAPGLDARLGIRAVAAPDGDAECTAVLYTSVHPRAWIGRLYFRLIQPFHHLAMEWFLLPRLRRRAGRP